MVKEQAGVNIGARHPNQPLISEVRLYATAATSGDASSRDLAAFSDATNSNSRCHSPAAVCSTRGSTRFSIGGYPTYLTDGEQSP